MADRRAVFPEFYPWKAMIRRCTNPRQDGYKHYGGRGITVCDRWRHSFDVFRRDVGSRPSPRHSLERIKNNVGYEPGNVRWATKREQAMNRRQRVRRVSDVLAHAARDWVQLPALVDVGIRAGSTRDSVNALVFRLVRLGQMETSGARGSRLYRTKGS